MACTAGNRVLSPEELKKAFDDLFFATDTWVDIVPEIRELDLTKLQGSPHSSGGFAKIRKIDASNVLGPLIIKEYMPSTSEILWQREVTALLLFPNHPHIQDIYAFGRRAVAPAIISPYYGRTLEEELQVGRLNGKPLSLLDRLTMLYQVGHAVGQLHKKGWLYRDLKPDNLRFENKGVIVLDFNLALPVTAGARSELSSLNNRCEPAGTRGYSAPEQLCSSSYDTRADIYSLGILAHWLLTGKEPWESIDRGNDILDAQKAIVDLKVPEEKWVPPVIASELETAAGETLHEIVRRCTPGKPGGRPPSIRTILEPVREVLDKYHDQTQLPYTSLTFADLL